MHIHSEISTVEVFKLQFLLLCRSLNFNHENYFVDGPSLCRPSAISTAIFGLLSNKHKNLPI